MVWVVVALVLLVLRPCQEVVMVTFELVVQGEVEQLNEMVGAIM
jgi:hypothetical protein